MVDALLLPPRALPPEQTVQSQHLLTLEPVPQLVGSARDFVAEHTPLLEPDTHETLVLLTSELVTNAVIHARTSLNVGVTVTADFVVVTVQDLDLGNTEEDPLQREGGRGFMLVQALAEEAGMHRNPSGGKIVWFRLARGTADPSLKRGNLWGEEFE